MSYLQPIVKRFTPRVLCGDYQLSAMEWLGVCSARVSSFLLALLLGTSRLSQIHGENTSTIDSVSIDLLPFDFQVTTVLTPELEITNLHHTPSSEFTSISTTVRPTSTLQEYTSISSTADTQSATQSSSQLTSPLSSSTKEASTATSESMYTISSMISTSMLDPTPPPSTASTNVPTPSLTNLQEATNTSLVLTMFTSRAQSTASRPPVDTTTEPHISTLTPSDAATVDATVTTTFTTEPHISTPTPSDAATVDATVTTTFTTEPHISTLTPSDAATVDATVTTTFTTEHHISTPTPSDAATVDATATTTFTTEPHISTPTPSDEATVDATVTTTLITEPHISTPTPSDAATVDATVTTTFTTEPHISTPTPSDEATVDATVTTTLITEPHISTPTPSDAATVDATVTTTFTTEPHISTPTPSDAATIDATVTTTFTTEPHISTPTLSDAATVDATVTTTLITEPHITPISTPTPTDSSGGESVFDKIRRFFENVNTSHTDNLVGVVLGPVVLVLVVILACIGCCCVRSFIRKKHKRKFELSHPSTTRNGVTSSHHSRSRTSLHELRHMDNDAFCSDYHYNSASQPYHATMPASDSAFLDPIPSISPLSFPSQLRNYMRSPDHGEVPSSLTPRISLSGSPGGLRRFLGSSPSLHRPTPLGEQLQKQAEKNSTQGSRNSIQGSRASISALGSRTSFSGSRNSFLSSNNTMSRDEIRNSGYLASKIEEDGGSQLSFRSLRKQTSLEMVPTRESPVQLPPHVSERRDFINGTCISNPLALQGEERERESREDGDGEDENDLRKDPLVPIMTSTPANQGAEDFPTREGRQQQTGDKSCDSSVFMSPRRKGNKSLQQLTSLTHLGGEEGEASASASETTPASSGAVGGRDRDKDDSAPKEGKPEAEKPRSKPMSRLEKLTSLDYIRSSIRRSLKKKRVSFLTRTTPDSTPKAKKKTPPRTLPAVEPDLEPDPLTFSNQGAFDSEEPVISPRIHTPSPLSPEFETVNEYPQRYPDDFFHPDIYTETHALRRPYHGGGGGGARTRGYSDMPMFPLQLSQPAYYPSTMHYPQPNYPQLSQQYIPQPYAPQQFSFMGSPAHCSFGPQPVQHPPESYGRRYTDSVIGGSAGGPPRTVPAGGGRGNSVSTQNPSTDHHRVNSTRSPDVYTETSNVSSSRYRDQSPDPSNISDVGVQSPGVYTSLVPGHNSYFEAPLRFRSIPTSPEERPFSPQYYPVQGAGVQYGERSVKTQPAPHYVERSLDSQQLKGGSYRHNTIDNQIQSPVHNRERTIDHQSTSGQYRRSSLDHQPPMTSHSRPSTEIQPNHVRQSSTDNQPPIASHIRRSSIDNQPPSTGNYRHSQPPSFRRNSIDNQPPGTSKPTFIDNHPGVQYREHAGFQPILEPGPYRNGMEVDGGWQHSQRDEQYGMGSQHHQHGRMGLLGWEDDRDMTKSPEPMERPVDSGTSTVKTRVSWNNEIIEHLRTPSDSSDHYDL